MKMAATACEAPVWPPNQMRTIEKTAMIRVDPESTSETVAGTVRELEELGFTATYVFSTGIDEPARVVDLIAEVAARTE